MQLDRNAKLNVLVQNTEIFTSNSWPSAPGLSREDSEAERDRFWSASICLESSSLSIRNDDPVRRGDLATVPGHAAVLNGHSRSLDLVRLGPARSRQL